jgi:hypothetical protein
MPRGQHLVPRSYLESFVINDGLYAYEIEVGLERENPVSPNSVLRAGKFYNLISHKGSNSGFETLLSKHEQVYAPDGFVQELIKSKNPKMLLENVDVILDILNIAHMRSPRATYQASMSALVAYNMQLVFDLEREASKYEMHTSEYKEKIQWAEKVWNGEWSVSRDFGKIDDERRFRQNGWDQLAAMSIIFCEEVKKMQFHFVETKEYFLCSDTPVCITNPNHQNAGLRLRGTEIWFPLSHNLGLLWQHKNSTQTLYDIAGHSKTRILNRRMMRNAYERLVSPIKEDWIQETCVKTKKRVYDKDKTLYQIYGDFHKFRSGNCVIRFGEDIGIKDGKINPAIFYAVEEDQGGQDRY